MSYDYTSKKFQKLLDKLQQDSWQLELLISGFAIFGLFSVIDAVEAPIEKAKLADEMFKALVLIMVGLSSYILIFNLLVHLVLRGLWIGALGLRYISGDIDFDTLNYSNRFENYLKKRIVSFDKYIATLENYCSVLFAISFLLIFYLISFFIIGFISGAIVGFIESHELFPELLKKIIIGVFLCIIGIGSLLTMIDFFTQGFLKKKKVLSKIYFPFYWAFSYLTLSFLYRPLIYNFLDNKFGRRISRFLVPLYIFLLFVTSAKYKPSNYLSDLPVSSITMKNRHYENMLVEDQKLAESITIQSKIIKENYLKLFYVFNSKIEDTIFKYAPNLKPQNDSRGYEFVKITSGTDLTIKKRDSIAKKYLETFNSMHHVYVDTIKFAPDFLISTNSKGQLGFETYISIKSVSEGKHVLTLKRAHKNEKVMEKMTNVSIIPFWYFKP